MCTRDLDSGSFYPLTHLQMENGKVCCALWVDLVAVSRMDYG